LTYRLWFNLFKGFSGKTTKLKIPISVSLYTLRYNSKYTIPGFKTLKQVEENCGALEFGSLTPAQMAEIDKNLGRA